MQFNLIDWHRGQMNRQTEYVHTYDHACMYVCMYVYTVHLGLSKQIDNSPTEAVVSYLDNGGIQTDR